MFVGGRRLASLAVGLAVALLAGCSGSSESPRTLPPLSTTPAASASTSPPQDPKAAAVAVVREYFRLLNNLNHDMDYGAVGQLMTSSCSCRQQVRAIRRAKLRGEHYIDHWRRLVLTPASNGLNAVDVLAKYDAAAGGLVDADGEAVTHAPPMRDVQRLFRVIRVVGAWKIAEIQAA